MSQVLLVCPEPLGHGQPAGIGIRFVEMARVLAAGGHDVTIMAPGGGSAGGRRVEALSPVALRHHTSQADVAVVQGHVANDLFAHGHRIPTVVDLYDPFIIENLHYYSERGAGVFAHDHATLLHSLVHGDFFLCASEAQRHFYLGALLAAGRLNPAVFGADPALERLLAIAPFGVHPPRPLPSRTLDAPSVLFGGIYDWYDPILAIDAVAIARRSLPSLTLTFTHHPNPGITPQGKAAAAMKYVEAKGYRDFVRFEPWVSYDRRGEFFDRFTLALLTFPQSIETLLAMRTRLYDFLWGALPVVTSSAPGTDEILERYGAGSIVRADSAEIFAHEIVAIAGDPSRYEAMTRATRAFVLDHQWERVLEPLAAFCRTPRTDETKEAFAVRLTPPGPSRSLFERLRRRIGGRR